MSKVNQIALPVRKDPLALVGNPIKDIHVSFPQENDPAIIVTGRARNLIGGEVSPSMTIKEEKR